MKVEEISYEGLIEKHIKIFMFLATKYMSTLKNYERIDLIHEQAIACYYAIEKYKPGGNISSFIYSVSENRLKTIYRSEMRQKRKPKQLLNLESARFEEAGLFLSGNESNPEQDFYLAEIKKSADIVAEQELSTFEYKLYLEIIKSNKTIKQVAKELGKSTKQIANGIGRVRSKLSKKRKFILKEMWYNLRREDEKQSKLSV